MRNRLTVVILAAFVFSLAFSAGAFAQTDTPPTTPPAPEKKEDAAVKAYEEGRKHFFLGEYDKAVESFSQAAQLDPTKTVYRLYLAKALRGAGKNDEALTIFLEILKENPDHVEAGLAAATIYEGGKKWQELINVLEPILQYKHDYTVYHLLAKAYYNNLPNLKEEAQAAALKTARTYYEKAVEQNPNSAADYYDLGNIYLGENRFALAAEAYEKCIALGVDTAIMHYKLATAYNNLRNYLGGVSEREIKGGKPGTIQQDLYLIDPVPDKKETFYVAPPRSAIFQVSRAITMGIDVPDILFLRANIWLGAGRFDKAHALYTELVDKMAEGTKALFYHQFAEATMGLGKYDDFLKYTGKAIELEPDTYKPTLANAYLRVANRKNQAGDTAGYIEYLSKAIEERPDVAAYHLLIASAYRDAKDYKKAVLHWKAVLEIEPDRPDRLELLQLIEKYSGAE